MECNDELSRSLIPEVWQVARKKATGVKHAGERRRFLRIVVLRELAMGVKQMIGSEGDMPKGLKLRREAGDKSIYVDQWLSERGQTIARKAVKAWGVADDMVEAFFIYAAGGLIVEKNHHTFVLIGAAGIDINIKQNLIIPITFQLGMHGLQQGPHLISIGLAHR